MSRVFASFFEVDFIFMYSAANICGSFKANISHYSAESLPLAPLYARLLSFLQEVAAFHFKFFVVFSKSEKNARALQDISKLHLKNLRKSAIIIMYLFYKPPPALRRAGRTIERTTPYGY